MDATTGHTQRTWTLWRSIVVALVATPVLAARCTCGGSRLYDDADVQRLANCPEPSAVAAADASAAAQPVAWVGVFQARTHVGVDEYLLYRFARVPDPQAVLSEARWLTLLTLESDVVKLTDQEYLVSAAHAIDDGPYSEAARATGDAAIWCGRATAAHGSVVLTPQKPVTQLELR